MIKFLCAPVNGRLETLAMMISLPFLIDGYYLNVTICMLLFLVVQLAMEEYLKTNP